MPVSYVRHTQDASETSQNPTIDITVDGTDPVLLVGIACEGVPAVSSVTWSLGSGTPAQVIRTTGADGGGPGSAVVAEIWAIPAPAAGAGTVTVNLGASAAHQIDVALFNGADQTTPCPTGDAVGDNTPVESPFINSMDALNVGANDGTYAIGANALANEPVSAAPNQLAFSPTTNVNYITCYNTGSSGVTITMNDKDGACSFSAVRIVEFTGGYTPTSPFNPPVKNEDFSVRIALEDLTKPGEFKVSPTIAAGDFQLDLDGAGFNNLTDLPTVSPTGTCSVKIDVRAAQMNADVVTIRGVDQDSPKQWADFFLSIPTTTG